MSVDHASVAELFPRGEHYEILWRRHVVGRIDQLPMRDITPRVVSGLKQRMLADGVGVETTRRTLTMLQGVFRLAMEWEEASSNPFACVQPHAQRELARWRCRALAIPDPCLRAHVLRPFEADQSAIGAALFAVLAPWRRQRALVRLLMAYVLLWSYVDVRTERDPHADPALYDALLDGLRDGTSATCATFVSDDAGYLTALLAACRRGCAALPSWETVAPAALPLARDGRAVQAINHGQPEAAETRLRAWARWRSGNRWHEVCAGASSPLALHALMALAAHPGVGSAAAHSTAAAYGPVSALGVPCDHLIDHSEDHSLVNHSYLPYLGSPTTRPDALHDLADRAARGVRQLRDGERHTVILAAMAAMFLSRPQASSPANRGVSGALLEALGPPAPQLLAALHARQRLELRPRCTTTS